MLQELKALSHNNECQVDYIGDGLPCKCGYSKAIEGLSSMIGLEDEET